MDATTRLWSAANGCPLRVFKLSNSTSWLKVTRFLPDGMGILSGGLGGKLTLWSVPQKSLIAAEMQEFENNTKVDGNRKKETPVNSVPVYTIDAHEDYILDMEVRNTTGGVFS